jgi:HEAT repeat protein
MPSAFVDLWARYMKQMLIVGLFLLISGSISHALRAAPPVALDPSDLWLHRPRSKSIPNNADSATHDRMIEGLSANLTHIADGTFSANATDRAKACMGLESLGERALPALPCLLRLLDDDAEVDLKPVTPMDFLIPTLDVRHYARAAIVRIGPAAVKPCLKALEHELGTSRGDQVIAVLGEIRDRHAIPTLCDLFKNKDVFVRVAAVRAVCSWKESEFVIPLINALKDDNPGVRLQAASTLRMQRDVVFVDPLLDTLNDKHTQIRREAASALGTQREPRAVPALARLLRNSAEDAMVRNQCALALGMIADQPAIDELMETVRNRLLSPELRRFAVFGLKESKNGKSILQLLSLAKDHGEDIALRCGVVDSIVDLDYRQASQILSQFAVDPHEMGIIRGRSALRLVEMANGAIDDVRIVGALAGSVDPQESIAAVVDWSDSKKEAFRLLATNGKTSQVREAARKRLMAPVPPKNSIRGN